ncbi:hypothetical protein WDZ92_02275 [Nostoc sp. NIES-2111]
MKQALSLAALPWLAHVGLVVLGILLGLGLDPAPAWDIADRYPPLAEAPAWAQPLLHWDAHHYARMSAEGYTLRTSVILPALPLTISGLAGLTGIPVWVVGLAACNLAGALSFVLMARLALHFFEPVRARRVVWSLALFPTSFYLNSFYTEPFFMAVMLGCILCCLSDRFVEAGLLAAAATLTRNLGIGLELVLLAATLPRLQQNPLSIRLGFALICAPLALGAFCLFQQARFGDALAFVHQQAHWGRSYHAPWQGAVDTIALLRERDGGVCKRDAYLWLNLLLVFWTVAGVLYTACRTRTLAGWGLTAYSTFLLLIPMLTGSDHDPLFSISRYVLVIPTAHLALGYLPPLGFRIWAMASAVCLVLAMALFSRGWWIA